MLLSMRSITPVHALSVYHEWANTQSQKTLLANKIMWRKMHEKELRQFYDDLLDDAKTEGAEDDLPCFEVFADIGFLVFEFNLCWQQTVQGEIDRITAPQPYKPK